MSGWPVQGKPAPEFTPMEPKVKNPLTAHWNRAGLPDITFDHWSVEFAREVYEIISMYQQPWMIEACELRGMDPEDELLVMLDMNGCFDEDQTAQQWVSSKGDRPWRW